MKFYELAVGAVFTAWGRTYRKSAMSMAEVLGDGPPPGCGSVFMAETEVVSDGPVLAPEVAARWKPDGRTWSMGAPEGGSEGRDADG